MMRSLFTGVTGLRAHQTLMDVIGNNIANINTVGFKRSRVIFEELLSETLTNATAPSKNLKRGGVNPKQIGLGTNVAAVETIFTQGSMQVTDKATDIAIQGNGFFIFNDGFANHYSRVGSIEIDAEGYFVHGPTGYRLQGYRASRDPETDDVIIDRDQALKDIYIFGNDSLPGEKLPAMATTTAKFACNLNSEAEDGETHNASIGVYDELGNKYTLVLTFTKRHNVTNEWDYEAHLQLEDGTMVNDPAQYVYNENGSPLPEVIWKFGTTSNTAVPLTVDFNEPPRADEGNSLVYETFTLTYNSDIDGNGNPGFSVVGSVSGAHADYVLGSDDYITDEIAHPVLGNIGGGLRFNIDNDARYQDGDTITITPEEVWEFSTTTSRSGINVEYISQPKADLSANPTLVEETFTLTMTGRDAQGRSVWSVVGSQSGVQPTSVTAEVAYTTQDTGSGGGGLSFTLKDNQNWVVGDTITINADFKNATHQEVAAAWDFNDTSEVPVNAEDMSVAPAVRGRLVFDPETGMLDKSKSSIYKIRFYPADDEGNFKTSNPVEITPNFDFVTQFASPFTTAGRNQNGYPMGSLQGWSVDESGIIRGVYSNGYKQPIGQIALATFNNNAGLYHDGESMYSQTVNSGVPFITAPNENGKGKISSGVLEMANVDLSKEFTDMIIAQRGFQANSRIIGVSDQLLQELVNLKR